jgi:hypothetical protein
VHRERGQQEWPPLPAGHGECSNTPLDGVWMPICTTGSVLQHLFEAGVVDVATGDDADDACPRRDAYLTREQSGEGSSP